MKNISTAILVGLFLVVISPTPVRAYCVCYTDNSATCRAFATASGGASPQCQNATTDPSSPSYIAPGTTANQQSATGNGALGQNLGYTPLEPIPGITSGSNGQAPSFPFLLQSIYKIAIIIGALFSVLMLTISGIRYMLSDIVTDKERAKLRIKASLYGLVLIAASWLILNTINPQLVIFNLNPPSSTITGFSNPSGTAAPAAGNTGPSTDSSGTCGNYQNCSANYYCANVSGQSTCIPNTNQTADQGCGTQGGQYGYTLGVGYYCYQPSLTTQAACQAQGYTWKAFWVSYGCVSS